MQRPYLNSVRYYPLRQLRALLNQLRYVIQAGCCERDAMDQNGSWSIGSRATKSALDAKYIN